MEVEEAPGELGGAGKDEEAAEYHSHDFEWEDLREEVESDPTFSYHLSPFPGPAASTTLPPQPSSEAWRSFHRRHASGKFFKVASPSPGQKSFSFFSFQNCSFAYPVRSGLVD
jgi:methyltransferase-like protein 6